MTDRESLLTRKFMKEQTARGALVYPLIGGKESPPGWPDRLFVHPNFGGLVMLEIKVKQRQLDKHQQVVCNKLRGMGVPVFVLRLFPEKLVNVEDIDGTTLVSDVLWEDFMYDEHIKGLVLGGRREDDEAIDWDALEEEVIQE